MYKINQIKSIREKLLTFRGMWVVTILKNMDNDMLYVYYIRRDREVNAPYNYLIGTFNGSGAMKLPKELLRDYPKYNWRLSFEGYTTPEKAQERVQQLIRDEDVYNLSKSAGKSHKEVIEFFDGKSKVVMDESELGTRLKAVVGGRGKARGLVLYSNKHLYDTLSYEYPTVEIENERTGERKTGKLDELFTHFAKRRKALYKNYDGWKVVKVIG